MDFDYSESAMNINDSDFDEVWDEIEMIEHCEKIEKSQLFDSEYDDQLYYLCVLTEKTEGQPRRPLIFTSSTSYPIRIANTVKRSIELEDGNKDVKRARVEEPSTSTDTAKSNGKVKMVKARKYVVTKRFDGAPKRSDFDIVEYELPHLEDKEILIKTEWISVDPYLRAYHSSLKVPYDQFSFNIGVVQESKDPKYPVGTKVVTHKGWCDYTIAKENEIVPSSNAPDTVYKVPDLKGLPESLAIGSVGMPGVSAYFGFLEICKPQPGETVVVSGAAGAVGTIVGQIAKIKGCKVIGFAGSDEKVNWLEKELDFDKAINYKTAAIAVALKEAAPEGVDCYYDNVGGDISTLVMSQMNEEGRVTVCGCISVYNEDFNQLPKSNMLQPLILFKELKVQGFLIWKKFHRWNEGFSQLVEWISKGQLKPTEHVTEGFDNLFDAFIGMLTGENKGKAVVKI